MPPEYEKLAKKWRHIISRCVTIIFDFVWTLILWIVFVYKLNADGWTFFTFFTNWNWTIQLIFFTIDFGAQVSGLHAIKAFNLSFIFWIASGTTWLVFWLVFFMIHDNSNFFLELSTVDGGPYQLWVVLLGHALFHVLISIALLVYVILQKKYVDDSCTPFLNWKHKKTDTDEEISSTAALFYHWRIKSIFYLLYVIFSGPFFLLIYAVSFNIYTTYGLTTPAVSLVFTALAVVLIFNGLYVFMNMLNSNGPETHLYKKYKKLRHLFVCN